MKNNKKHIIPLGLITAVIVCLFIYTNKVVGDLKALGYTNEEALNISKDVLFDYKIVNKKEKDLKKTIEVQQSKATNVIGIEVPVIDKSLKETADELVAFNNEKEVQLITKLNEEISKADLYEVDVEIESNIASKIDVTEVSKNSSVVVETAIPLIKGEPTVENKSIIKVIEPKNITLKAKADEITFLVNNKEEILQEKLRNLKESLISLGKSKEEVESQVSKDLIKSIDDLTKSKDSLEAEIKKIEYEKSYDIKAREEIFRQLNVYRAESGLKPFEYNTEMQSCMDAESKYYAETLNPHGWLCKSVANENAGMGNIKNADFVTPAINWWKNSPSHNAPMLGNYNSVAISAYVNDKGSVFMEIGFFN